MSGSGNLHEFPLRHVGCAGSREHPGAAALAFEQLLQLFVIHDLIGCGTWTRNAHKKGIFGNCRAFFGPTEEIGRLSLHLHLLIWIQDAEKFEKLLDTEEGREKMAKYIDSVVRRAITSRCRFLARIAVDFFFVALVCSCMIVSFSSCSSHWPRRLFGSVTKRRGLWLNLAAGKPFL